MGNPDLEPVLTAALEGRIRDLRTRQRVLKALHASLSQHADDLVQATVEDDGISVDEAQVVLAAGLLELSTHYGDLDLKEELDKEYSISRKKSSLDKRGPCGIVFVVPDVYTAAFGTITAVSAAIAAGNCVIIELQDGPRRSPGVMRCCIADTQYSDLVAIVSSRPAPDILRKCLVVDQGAEDTVHPSECFQLLPSVAQRTVAIVDRTGDVTAAAKEIAMSSLLFHGQGRYRVDQVFVNEYVLEAFHKTLKEQLGRSLYHSHHKMKSGSDSRSKGLEFPVLEIQSRSDPLLHQGKPRPGLVIHKVTSLDDTIDTVLEGQRSLGALYVFAGYDEAKYLSQFIPARAAFVNHIPPELQIGPAYPAGFKTSTSLRYTREMFETPRPERVDDNSVRLSSQLWSHIKDGKARGILSKACRPLKPTGQGKAGAMDFFLQGMILNAVVCVLPLAALSIAGAVHGVPKLYQWFLSR